MTLIQRHLLPGLFFAVLSGVSGLWAGDAPDPLLALPDLPKIKPTAIAAPSALKEFAPGVLVAIGETVALTGTIIIDQGPVDGMEVLACLATGKTHESLLRLDAANGQLVKAAFIAALGLTDGLTAPEATGHPGRGTPLRVVVEWESLDAPGTWHAVDASCLIRDRTTDKAYPALPFTYTGSRFQVVDETAPDGRPVRQERFMLDNTKSVVGIVDEPDALIASFSPGAGTDKHFEANSAICPPAGTKARLVFSKTTLPLTVVMDASGGLHADGGGAALDDPALDALLAKHYGTGSTPALRAVGVQVDAATPRDHDITARLRILAAAARAKAWVVPVYLLAKAP
ncbi:MAG TPA: YdjY domain-containing protein [Planctomycetota bacterium]|nr:YdjY domain-containing protein [Planctomycetota bacterium]